MLDKEEGTLFWRRFDSVKPPELSLEEVAQKAQISFDSLKRMRALGFHPNAIESCHIAQAIHVPLEFLINGEINDNLDDLRIGYTEESYRILSIIEALYTATPDQLQTLEEVLHIGQIREESSQNTDF